MVKDSLKFYSVIKPAVQKKLLWVGTLKAALGALLIVVTGGFLPVSILGEGGFLFFITGLALIVWGLLPYKRVMQLQKHPHVLLLDESGLHIFLRGKAPIHLSSITSMQYRDSPTDYGIIVEPGSIFLPYFSKAVFNDLRDS